MSQPLPHQLRPAPLPFLRLPQVPVQDFVPEVDTPLETDKPLPLFFAAKQSKAPLVPRPKDCYAWWDKYSMLSNIRAHSQKVADLGLAIANKAVECGQQVHPGVVYAAGLLHAQRQ